MKIHKTILILLMFFLMGCQYDAREIDQRTMVVGMAVDKTEDGEFQVAIQVPVITPSEGEPGPTQFETINEVGPSVWETITKIESKTPTVLFFGHLKAVVIGETLAKEGVGQVLDMLDRRAPLANQILLLVIESDVNSFLDQESSLVTLPSLYIDRFFKADQKLARTKEVRLFQFRRDMSMKGRAAFMPLAYLEGESIVIENKAVFHGDKLIAKLTDKQASISHLLKDLEVTNTNYVLKMEQEGEEISVSMRVNLEGKYQFEKRNPAVITMDVKGDSELVHITEKSFQTKREHLDQITEKLEEEIKADILTAIDQMREINVEPWLIGHRIWAKDVDYYKSLNWEETGFQKAEFHFNIEIEMEQTGQKGMLDKKKVGE